MSCHSFILRVNHASDCQEVTLEKVGWLFLHFHEVTENTDLRTAQKRQGWLIPLSDLNTCPCKVLPLALEGPDQNSEEPSNQSKTHTTLAMGTGLLRVLQHVHEIFGKKFFISVGRDVFPLLMDEELREKNTQLILSQSPACIFLWKRAIRPLIFRSASQFLPLSLETTHYNSNILMR